MSKIRIAFIVLLIVFLTSWGIKVNLPVNRPSNITGTEQEAWFEREYSHLYGDDDWYVPTDDVKNYVLVDGYTTIYSCEQTDGSLKYYKKIDGKFVEIEILKE